MKSMKKPPRICLVTNIGSHYRFPIFSALGEQLGVEFYLGDRVETELKTFDYQALKGFRATLHNVFLGHFFWQRGSLRTLFRPYTHYILDGEPYNLSSWAMVLLAKIMRKRTYTWTHGWYGREGWMKRWVKRAYFSLYSHHLIYGEYAIALMAKEGFDRAEMHCIANSLDSDYLLQLRHRLRLTDVYRAHFGNDFPTLIYCGRIQRAKRLDLLIDAVAQLRQEDINVNIVMVGKDVEDVQLSVYAQKKGVEQLWMYGPCYDDERLGELFYNAAACVSPGHVGLTAIHALSLGCPVITHNNFPYQAPEFEAIRPGVTGDFFEQNDVESLKESIKHWITLSAPEREKGRLAAYEEIDRKWNVHHQLEVIKEAIYE